MVGWCLACSESSRLYLKNSLFLYVQAWLTLLLLSSILVYHFCKHAQDFCSTWMTSRMQFEKNEGSSFWTGILV